MLHWRHKRALESWAPRTRPFLFSSAFCGETTFRHAIAEGWIEAVGVPLGLKWWQAYYQMTEKGRDVLASAYSGST